VSADNETIRRLVRRSVEEARITDIHTHLFSPPFGPLMLGGIDEILGYHYLAAEALRWSDLPYEAFWRLDLGARADFIWKKLFVDHSPTSEACRGVLTVLQGLGLDTASRDLAGYRAFFACQKSEDHMARVFDIAGVESVVMTNDPSVWLAGVAGDPRFRASLRLDVLLNSWETAVPALKSWGFDVAADFGGRTVAEVRRFLIEWIDRTGALYLAVSLPPAFAYPEASTRGRLLENCVLPAAAERSIPLALMIGVKRGVNPELRLAGDGAARADVGAVERLCRDFPASRFLATLLSRENQFELCVAARKFRNLMIFGCWWFLNNPTLVREMTGMRIDLLGGSFIPQHSDARVLEQLIYKWAHARKVVGEVLIEKYEDLAATGWAISEEEIRRDVGGLFGGNFWAFAGRA
jgi:hypothetical protein